MTFNETKDIFTKLFKNELDESVAKELLVSMYSKGESYEEIAAAAEVMREHSLKLDISDDLREKLIDNCGTGGDKSGSFNISTTVSLLLASCGSYVAKHGNRSITSNSGSADMLEALGINLNLDVASQAKMLQEVGFTFMFAVNHHKAMKYIMPIRKSLSHRTVFNILGPLTNPAGVNKQLIGVFDKDYISRITKALNLLGSKRAVVVSSKDGLDEISISDITYASSLIDGKISEFEINPKEFGFKLASLDDIKGADAVANAKITEDILSGDISGAKRDIVLLNTAYALYVDGKTRDIKDGIDMAREAIDSKKAINHLRKIVEVSNKL
jgi:anthranilate phosphoribosyltransferase